MRVTDEIDFFFFAPLKNKVERCNLNILLVVCHILLFFLLRKKGITK